MLKSQELKDRLVYGSVETDTAFVRADSVVVLDTVTHVRLDLSLIVHPSYTERENAIGDTKALDQVAFLKFRMLVVSFLDSP